MEHPAEVLRELVVIKALRRTVAYARKRIASLDHQPTVVRAVMADLLIAIDTALADLDWRRYQIHRGDYDERLSPTDPQRSMVGDGQSSGC